MIMTEISNGWAWLFVVLAVWELVWKGLALWRAAKRDEKGWFVALLVVNTVGIFPIIYLLVTNGKNTEK